MICHKDKTFCASSGACANTDCDRWINLGKDYELPISMAEIKGTEHCAGFIEHPALTSLRSAVEGAMQGEHNEDSDPCSPSS